MDPAIATTRLDFLTFRPCPLTSGAMTVLLIAAIQFWSSIASAEGAAAQTLPARVEIRFGVLDTTAYPSVNHPTEWKQELFADVYDSTGILLPPSSQYVYTWGVDFCKGYGMQFGWASGKGLYTISPDGSKIKTDAGCSDVCPFQTYLVAVRVGFDDELIESKGVLIPNISMPAATGLSLNYPNPFSSRTYIKFQLTQYSRVQLRVFDLLGRSVAELFNNYLAPGYHSAAWQPANAANGIYFYRLTVRPDKGTAFIRMEKMLLLK